MLQSIPPILPVSDLRSQAKEILAKASDQPVVITQNGRPSAVIINYKSYNEIAEKLRELEQYQQSDREAWSTMSEAALHQVWNNEMDAAYDNWKELYGISAR